MKFAEIRQQAKIEFDSYKSDFDSPRNYDFEDFEFDSIREITNDIEGGRPPIDKNEALDSCNEIMFVYFSAIDSGIRAMKLGLDHDNDDLVDIIKKNLSRGVH